jgi:hypothetical protein
MQLTTVLVTRGDLFACVQKPDEPPWDFIRRFSDIHNTIPDMVDDQVTVAFK